MMDLVDLHTPVRVAPVTLALEALNFPAQVDLHTVVQEAEDSLALVVRHMTALAALHMQAQVAHALRAPEALVILGLVVQAKTVQTCVDN
jgi:hypothetical protein